MPSSLVKTWFGDKFHDLSPEIQHLHLHGGQLTGSVEVMIGKGIAGFIGKKLCKKLGIPGRGRQHLVVDITHKQDGLHWDRVFNDSTVMKSIFIPVGDISTGYWVEKTGPVELRLTVEIKDGGWYWKIQSYRFNGIRIPQWLFPRSVAFKRIEDDKYRFFVGFSLPILGELISYGGLLSLDNRNG